MAYGVNGTDFTMQPTSFRWLPRTIVGRTGDGHPIYPAIMQGELRWNVNAPVELNQILGFYNAVALTGTATVTLPQWGASTYVFKNYSGCTLSEPEVNVYFVEHYTEVLMVVDNIRV